MVILKIPFAVLRFFSPFTIRWSHGDQFWTKIVGGILCVTSKVRLCEGLLPFQPVQIQRVRTHWVALESRTLQSWAYMLSLGNTIWYVKPQRFEGYWLSQHPLACPVQQRNWNQQRWATGTNKPESSVHGREFGGCGGNDY